MNILGKHHNYDPHPTKKIDGFEGHAFGGMKEIEEELLNRLEKILHDKKKARIHFDFYPGVQEDEMKPFIEKLDPALVICMEDCIKSEEQLKAQFGDFITQDRVFGIICHKKMGDLFDAKKLTQMKEKADQIKDGLVFIYGVGAGLLGEADLTVYCNLTRWEIQLRYRAGMTNLGRDNGDEPVLTKYKIGFFIEWRLADRYKKQRYEQFDYVLDTETPGQPKMITGDAFRAGLNKFSKEPFRLEPYFDPGVWGGHWMQENFDLSKEKDNLAWSFDGVPEENSINMQFGDVVVKVPAIDLVFYRPKELLGDRVHARFGAEFPIRFDLLDTMGGGNLSLQVHPLTEYIQEQFGMNYTQDESYYLLDTGKEQDTYVYLGTKKGIDKAQMAQDLRRAQTGEIAFPAEKYINKVPVKKHDHILIPAGTLHCSGKDTMVLEISATPYIFTFKLWDWGRVGLDGVPRPIHVEHGLKNIQWDRDTDFIYNELIHQEEEIWASAVGNCERTGLHNREFLDTFRYHLREAVKVESGDSVHMMNLVEGKAARIESVNGEFEPFEVHYAETAIVPASVGSYKIVPLEGEIKMIVANVRK